ncbi:uncharacterized protein METZ01_LOCUS318881, partial [marine metagenome]
MVRSIAECNGIGGFILYLSNLFVLIIEFEQNFLILIEVME